MVPIVSFLPRRTRVGVPAGRKTRQVLLGLLVTGNWVAICAAQSFPQGIPNQYGYPPQNGMTAPSSGIAPISPAAMMAPPSVPTPSMVAPAYGHVMEAPGLSARPVSMIQPVQNTADSARLMHEVIEAMPKHQDDLELIERRSQLMITRANLVRYAIADPGIVDLIQFSPKEFSLLGGSRGSTTLHLWFEGHTDPVIYLVKTIRDPDLDNQRRIDYGRLEAKINRLYPNSQIYLIPMSFKIIVRGQARNQEEAAHILATIRGEVISQDGGLFGPQAGAGGFGAALGAGGTGLDFLYGNGNGFGSSFIINEIRIPGEFQINLRVRLAELNRSAARNMGIDWNVLFNDSRHLITSSMGGVPSTLGGVFENGEIGVFLNWLASNGTAKILVEPQLTVISGRSARLLAGGEFAVPTTVGIGGAAGTTTSFRGYGTSLQVTPTVEDRDMIRISTLAEYSDLDTANSVGGIPGTQSRRIETVVEMREGQTLALAGLLSHKQMTIQTRIPYLGDIPKIGPWLFSSKRSSQEENELLILITPEIVRPMDAHEVPPMPGFEVTHPMDHEFYKYNMTEGMPDPNYSQLPPYGSGSKGTNVGYQHFNPGPAGSMYSPVPTNPNGTGFSTPGSPTPIPNGMPSGPATAVPMGPTPPPTDRRQPMNSGAMLPNAGPNGAAQAGYTAPTRPSQTIMPTNGTATAPASRNAARAYRDQAASNRY
ncbi:MAG TPA: pilus assembly protein N-terminal domain-containing protein [Planctomycetaceae bacterium]|nr:pilus assembly protein N-terminal domain-containing protein [Planctomycetaceae bacterium]